MDLHPNQAPLPLVIPVPALRTPKKLKSESVRLLRRYTSGLSRSRPTEVPLLHQPGADLKTLKYITYREGRGKSLSQNFVSPSAFCSPVFGGYFLDLAMEGWQLAWTRLIFLPPGGAMKFHVDLENGADSTWRLHLPLQSNSRCLMEWAVARKSYSVHLPTESGAYLLRVNVPHRAVNRSRYWRIHMVASLLRVPVSYSVIWKN